MRPLYNAPQQFVSSQTHALAKSGRLPKTEEEKQTYQSALNEAFQQLDVPKRGLIAHGTTMPGPSPIGTLNSAAAHHFVNEAKTYWGVNQLFEAPAGLTKPIDMSPYTSTLYGFSPLSIDLEQLTQPAYADLLKDGEVKRFFHETARNNGEVSYEHAYERQQSLLRQAYDRFTDKLDANDPEARQLNAKFEQFKTSETTKSWLPNYSLYYALSARYGQDYYPNWEGPHAQTDKQLFSSELPEEQRQARLNELKQSRFIQREQEAFAFSQFLAHRQHHESKAQFNQQGVQRIGDWQFGQAPVDVWARPDSWMPNKVAGVPPDYFSETGQYWGVKLAAPEQADTFMARKATQLAQDYDGFRQDHTVGYVDPWVIDENEERTARAKRQWNKETGEQLEAKPLGGERLYSSPFGELERYAKISKDDVNPKAPGGEEGEHWVKPEAAEREARAYSSLLEKMYAAAQKAGVSKDNIYLENLGTVTNPTLAALNHVKAGGMRVTMFTDHRESNPDAPEDEGFKINKESSLQPNDLAIFSTHDNQSVEAWLAQLDKNPSQTPALMARDLSKQLAPDKARSLEKHLLKHPWELVNAKVAALYASQSKAVLLNPFNLIAEGRTYNRPGTQGPPNWRLSLPENTMEQWAKQLEAGKGVNIPKALALAWHAKGLDKEEAGKAVLKNLIDSAALLETPEGQDKKKDPVLELLRSNGGWNPFGWVGKLFGGLFDGGKTKQQQG